MLPLVRHVADGGQYTIAGSRDVLADQFSLSEEERKERLPSGAANRFYNRLAWAKTYLERAGLIEMVRRGCFKISPAGAKVLANPPQTSRHCVSRPVSRVRRVPKEESLERVTN